MGYLALAGFLVAFYFFHKATKAKAFSDDATYGGAVKSIFKTGRQQH